MPAPHENEKEQIEQNKIRVKKATTARWPIMAYTQHHIRMHFASIHLMQCNAMQCNAMQCDAM